MHHDPEAPVVGPPAGALLGKSAAMEAVRRRVVEYGRTEAPVLVTGETGTGKELVARALHAASRRRAGPFVAVNCAALTLPLFESELFGSTRGAFTGADRERPGLVGQAAGGTLFLDEVGELPLEAQPKLLRLLEEGVYRRVGASEERPSRVRIVAATNRDPRAAVAAGGFRPDLYYRLSVLCIQLPPLRARREDVEELLHGQLARLGEPGRRVLPAALRQLHAWHWPGNVRELRHAVERTLLRAGPGPIGCFELDAELLPPLAGDPAWAGSAAEAPAATDASAAPGRAASRAEFRLRQRGELLEALNEERWNVSATARRLGVSRGALRSRMRRLGLEG